MGIMRGIEAGTLGPLLERVIASGLRTVEVTMNTPKASTLIRQMAKTTQNRLMVGAGTVLTMDDLHAALDAGATFIVLPTLVDEVVTYCANRKIPVFPGALTPQEIYRAWCAGATMVKVFPAKFFGPAYIKEIKGPFQNIDLLACGGITTDNIQLFFSAGASAIAFGGSIFKKEWLVKGEFFHIEERIKTLIIAFQKLKSDAVT
jgi:2-dehydro-3-deoxyphosphogluconate aldolase/(4S)-4-hydroxy-2-oxoglutarate aldolase